jgi:hypothetical protein
VVEMQEEVVEMGVVEMGVEVGMEDMMREEVVDLEE